MYCDTVLVRILYVCLELDGFGNSTMEVVQSDSRLDSSFRAVSLWMVAFSMAETFVMLKIS